MILEDNSQIASLKLGDVTHNPNEFNNTFSAYSFKNYKEDLNTPMEIDKEMRL